MKLVSWTGMLFGNASTDRSVGKSDGQARVIQLKDVLRTNQILQAMFTQVAQRSLCGQLIADQVGGRRGKQGLATMGDCHQPRGAVERRSIVVTGARLGLARVQADADPQRVRVEFIPRCCEQSLLSGQSRGHTVHARLKGGMESIAGGLDDVAAVTLDRLAQKPVMAGQGAFHRLGILFPELGAAFNIGKKKSYGSGGE